MNAKQDNKLAMYRAVSALLSDSATLVSRVPALATKAAALQTQIDHLVQLTAAQALPTTGVSAGKDQAFEAMADAALAVSGAVTSYASEKTLPELAARVAATGSSFHYGRQQARLLLAQQIHDAAAEIVADLADFGVTAATLTDLQTKIAAATDAIAAPRGAVTSRKAATEELEPAFDAVDELLAKGIDPLLLAFKASDPSFYRDYHAARIIIDRPGGYGGAKATANTTIAATPAPTTPAATTTTPAPTGTPAG